MEEEYKPNSNKYREEKENLAADNKKIEPVAKGTVKKKSEFRKLGNIFISEDAPSVKSYIFLDVLVPAIKKAIADIVTNGINIILYGDAGKGKQNGGASKVSYRSYYNDQNGSSVSYSRQRRAYDYDDVIINTRGEAEEILMRMDELISSYRVVSVADFYYLAVITPEYTDNKYGWTDIRSANIVRVRDGYMIKLPRAVPLD